jgi:lipopolysaccharide biosynthesis glycosyltransferase
MKDNVTQRTDVPNATSVQFLTIVARNYLAYAFVLGKSIQQHHPDASFSIFLTDDTKREWQAAIEAQGFRSIYPEEIALEDYRKFVFKYNITEACTAVKPTVIQTLLDRGAEKVIYVDPDVLCFRCFDEVLTALDKYCVVLAPHVCSPTPDDYYPGETALMSTGVFNLGFIAMRKSETSRQVNKWWSQHLSQECIEEPEMGLFVDQKWMDLVPACFDDVYIMRSAAYDVAYWNLRERTLEERDGVLYEKNSGERLAFFHFSGITLDDLNGIHKYALGNPFGKALRKKRFTLAQRPDLTGLFHHYKALLMDADMQRLSKIPYAYSAYENGEPISQLERSLYLSSESWLGNDSDPFQTGAGSFWGACRKAGVRPGNTTMRNLSVEKIVKKYGFYMRAIEFTLKCILRVLGPQRYLQFAKYMRYQLLPVNHGFLLKQRVASRPVEASTAAHLDKQTYGTST